MEALEHAEYQAHSMLAKFDKQVQRSRQIVVSALEVMKRPYASLSLGKDSIVMVHLLASMIDKLNVMYVNCGKWDEWPDTERVKAEFLERIDCNFIELSGPSIIDAYRKAGFYIQDEEGTKAKQRAQRDYGKSLELVLDGEADRRGFDGAFIGMRKEESNNRRRLFYMRGELYYAKTRQKWACCPVMHWTGKDVWAYIVKHNLPWNELYDLDPHGRERARNGAMFGTRSARYGRLAFMKQMYPGWFAEFSASFPEVARWL